MKDVYCLSGLGADYRIFTNLKLPGINLIHIPWPEHDKHDELSCYAQKVSVLIKADDPIIIGVSLGGMIGVEISKIRDVKKLILISSAKTKQELPQYDTWFGNLMRSKILPPFMYKLPNSVLFNKFGVETDEDEALIYEILKDADGRFMKWAMWAVATWDNNSWREPVVHIHGRKDKMLLPDDVNAQYWIDDGGHMMIYNRAAEISEIILSELADI